jgi:hypothetical protein
VSPHKTSHESNLACLSIAVNIVTPLADVWNRSANALPELAAVLEAFTTVQVGFIVCSDVIQIVEDNQMNALLDNATVDKSGGSGVAWPLASNYTFSDVSTAISVFTAAIGPSTNISSTTMTPSKSASDIGEYLTTRAGVSTQVEHRSTIVISENSHHPWHDYLCIFLCLHGVRLFGISIAATTVAAAWLSEVWTKSHVDWS